MYSGEHIRDIVLWQHYLFNTLEILRLILLQPQNLRRCKACKRDISRVLRQLILANLVIEIINLALCASIIPKYRRTNNIIVFIKNNKTVHLTAERDTLNKRFIAAVSQLSHTLLNSSPPILGFLLRPTVLGEVEWIFLCHGLNRVAVFVRHQHLNR